MTRIDFYTRVDDRERFACKLCAKAFAQGRRVAVFTADAEGAERFDRLLWTASPASFIPHVRADSPLAPVTPILIHHIPAGFLFDDILLNLSDERPAFFTRFQRLIEIVSLNEEDAARARERFRFYRDRGYPLATHDMSDPRATGAHSQP
jgi:DNA polymerase-3 subunit chi